MDIYLLTRTDKPPLKLKRLANKDYEYTLSLSECKDLVIFSCGEDIIPIHSVAVVNDENEVLILGQITSKQRSIYHYAGDEIYSSICITTDLHRFRESVKNNTRACSEHRPVRNRRMSSKMVESKAQSIEFKTPKHKNGVIKNGIASKLDDQTVKEAKSMKPSPKKKFKLDKSAKKAEDKLKHRKRIKSSKSNKKSAAITSVSNLSETSSGSDDEGSSSCSTSSSSSSPSSSSYSSDSDDGALDGVRDKLREEERLLAETGATAKKIRTKLSPSVRWGQSLCLANVLKSNDQRESIGILVGGQAGQSAFSKDSLWRLNTKTNTWIELDSESEITERVGHTTIFDPEQNCFYVLGGSRYRKWFTDVNQLSMKSWMWTSVKGNGVAPSLSYHSANLYHGEIWLFGGVTPQPEPAPDSCVNEVHVFNPIDGSWYSPIVMGDKPNARSGHSSDLLDDVLVIFGGWDAPKCFSDLQILDLGICEWMQPKMIGKSPSARCWHSSTVIDNNRLVIHGGYDGQRTLSDTYMFYLDTLSWTEIKVAIPDHPRAGHNAFYISEGIAEPPPQQPAEQDSEDVDGSLSITIFAGGDNRGDYFSDLVRYRIPSKCLTQR